MDLLKLPRFHFFFHSTVLLTLRTSSPDSTFGVEIRKHFFLRKPVQLSFQFMASSFFRHKTFHFEGKAATSPKKKLIS